MNNGRKILILVIVLVFASLFAFFSFHTKTIRNENYFVHEGDGLYKVGIDLEEIGVIHNSFKFKVYAKIWSIVNGCGGVPLGEYEIKKGESFNDLIEKFCNGKTVLKTLTIPEGLETREIVGLINNNEHLIGKKVVFFDEGKILPETYSFQSGTKRDEVFEKMRTDFDNFINEEWEKRDKNDVIKTKEEAIILASIVEKEAKTDEERPIIASVYLNRLKSNRKLEADPTTIYELTKGKYKLNRLLTRVDLQVKGEYNTYRKKGLPIAPICNPGKKSILAVLHPDKTDYIYFVAKEDLSGHYFAVSYKDHLKNIKFVKSHNSAK